MKTDDKDNFNLADERPEDFREDDELALLEGSDDVSKLRSVLQDGEVVHRLVLCFHDESDGVLAATNRRIIFADKRFITSKVVTFNYSEVAAVVYETQLVTHEITLVHKSGSLTVSKVDKEHGDRFIEFISDRIGQDYSVQGKNGRVFKHHGELLELNDLPSQQKDIE